MQTRRGGLLGLHMFKTTSDNRRNCMSKFKTKRKQRRFCSDKMLNRFDYRSNGKMERKKPSTYGFS